MAASHSSVSRDLGKTRAERGRAAAEVAAGSDEPLGEEPSNTAPLPPLELATLGRRLDRLLASPALAGAEHSVLIVEADSGQELYAREPDRLLKPASTTKLFTTAAALLKLGPAYRFTITVYRSGPLVDGILQGDLILRAEHEPSSASLLSPEPSLAVKRLAAETVSRGVAAVTGTVRIHGELLYQGDRWASYDPAAHRQAFARAFVAALRQHGVRLSGQTAAAATLAAPSGGAEALLTWQSPTLAEICRPINQDSHNELADILGRHLGYQRSSISSYRTLAEELTGLLASIGLDPAGVRFSDGSGLSHANRVSARHIIGLLRHVLSQPIGPLFQQTLAVAGHSGSLAGRLRGPDTSGRLYGKTGTLTGTTAVSGLLDHRYDGRRYLFALLMGRVADRQRARQIHNEMLRELAADRRPSGSDARLASRLNTR